MFVKMHSCTITRFGCGKTLSVAVSLIAVVHMGQEAHTALSVHSRNHRLHVRALGVALTEGEVGRKSRHCLRVRLYFGLVDYRDSRRLRN